MSKHPSDSMTAALQSLDPAPARVLTDAERERADATFARIVATRGDEPVLVEPVRPWRRRLRLLVPVGVVGAAVSVVIPALLLGGDSAFATWTPTPEPLTPAETSAAAATCHAHLNEVPNSGGRALVAERRGEWTYVLTDGLQAEASCIIRNDGREIFGDYNTQRHNASTTAARDRIVEMGSTQVSTGGGDHWWSSWFQEEGWLTWVYGDVGRDVTGVTVHTPLGFDVEASVDNGRFAAWWPSDQPSSENTEVMGAWTYTVTLADGSTRDTSG